MFSNDDALYSLQCFYAAIGTCSAIAHAANGKNGNWCCTGGTISSSLVAWYVRELEDDSRVPRRDIYDVLLISDVPVSDHLHYWYRHMLSTGTLSSYVYRFISG